MAVHRIEPTPEATVNAFSAEHVPVAAIESGDTVVVRSLDAGGLPRAAAVPGGHRAAEDVLRGMWGHCLNRPIAVCGAAPGGMLAVHIELLTPDAWCWTSTPGPDSPVARRLSLGGDAKARLLWEIDAEAGTATANGKYAPAGSTIYLPVNVNGALLYLGDGHAAQGGGESGHTAIDALDAMVTWLAAAL